MGDSVKKWHEMQADKKNAKLITEELIEQKMISYGFGEKDSHDEDHVRKLILDYYDSELTADWNNNADFFMYEETTADGYSIYVATDNPNGNVSINEHVFYYESQLSDSLQDAIKDGCDIYVDDLYQDYIDDAFRELYTYLAEKHHEQATDELQDEGYELDTDE